MADTVVLSCEKREVSRAGRQQLRQKERVPAVVYGKGADNLHISLEGRSLTRIFNLYGARGIFALEVAGESRQVMALVRDVQRNPLTGGLVHVDFLRVRADEKITSAVPIVLQGEEEVMAKGGILQAGIKEVEVECLPAELPDVISIDISHLDMGEKITVEELQVPSGVKILSDPVTVVVSVLHPTRIEDEEAPETADEGEADTAEGTAAVEGS